MKKIYYFLKIFTGCLFGLLIGRSLWQYYDYRTYPELYAMNSAPWYTGILMQGVITGILAIVTGIIMWIIRKRR